MEGSMDNLEIEKYYEEVLAVFRQPGWKHLVEDWSTALAEIDSVVGCTTIEQLHERRGRADVLVSLINLHDSIEAAQEAYFEQEDEDDTV
jgi:hypothetical protein